MGLVIVEGPSHDVRLVHYTLQEYLSENTVLFPNPHEMIAEVCLTYLNFQCVRGLPLASSSPPLLEYSSLHWGYHTRRGITESATTVTLRLLDRFDKHVSSKKLLSYNFELLDDISHSSTTGFTGLHCTAYLGIVAIAVPLLGRKKWDPNAIDVTGNTAILWAAKKGHGAMVRMLLQQENLVPDTTDKDGRTPLLLSATKGYGDIVEMLLDREDVTFNTADSNGRTPLSQAAGNGHRHAVKMLLKQNGITPDTADKDGRTPLSWAARNGYDVIVGMLLKRKDVTPDAADKDGRTPLSLAVQHEHIRVVEMFQNRCSPAQGMAMTDLTGQIALTQTSEKRRVGSVKRRLSCHGSAPHSGSNGSRNHSPAEPSQPSQRPAKRARRF